MTELRTAIITGASSGVGEATARALAELGMDLALVARRHERLEGLAKHLPAQGRGPLIVPADLRDAAAAQRAMDEALHVLGTIDVLVNCAGSNVPRRRLSELSVQDWDSLVAINLSAVFYCVRAVLPSMRERGSGLIISVSSIAGLRPSALSGAAYSAAKAGLNALSACINLEEGQQGIRSCVICPGDIDTEILDKRPEPPSAEARAHMLRARDVADLIAAVIRQPDRVLLDEIVVRPR